MIKIIINIAMVIGLIWVLRTIILTLIDIFSDEIK
jgi:uncharacterized protein involved in cysteine biosynthesis